MSTEKAQERFAAKRCTLFRLNLCVVNRETQVLEVTSMLCTRWLIYSTLPVFLETRYISMLILSIVVERNNAHFGTSLLYHRIKKGCVSTEKVNLVSRDWNRVKMHWCSRWCLWCWSHYSTALYSRKRSTSTPVNVCRALLPNRNNDSRFGSIILTKETSGHTNNRSPGKIVKN